MIKLIQSYSHSSFYKENYCLYLLNKHHFLFKKKDDGTDINKMKLN